MQTKLLLHRYHGKKTKLVVHLLKMKREIDTKLTKITHNLDVENPLRRNRRSNQFLIKAGIEKEKFIQILYNQLHTNKLIDVEYQKFRTHFDNNWVNPAIDKLD